MAKGQFLQRDKIYELTHYIMQKHVVEVGGEKRLTCSVESVQISAGKVMNFTVTTHYVRKVMDEMKIKLCQKKEEPKSPTKSSIPVAEIKAVLDQVKDLSYRVGDQEDVLDSTKLTLMRMEKQMKTINVFLATEFPSEYAKYQVA